MCCPQHLPFPPLKTLSREREHVWQSRDGSVFTFCGQLHWLFHGVYFLSLVHHCTSQVLKRIILCGSKNRNNGHPGHMRVSWRIICEKCEKCCDIDIDQRMELLSHHWSWAVAPSQRISIQLGNLTEWRVVHYVTYYVYTMYFTQFYNGFSIRCKKLTIEWIAVWILSFSIYYILMYSMQSFSHPFRLLD